MNNIEVGDYIRSKINGMISKITDIEQFEELGQIVERYILDNNYNKGFCSTEKDSVIASHNIIDLIEVGDILCLYIVKDNQYITIEIIQDYYKDWIEDIKLGKLKLLSIVTKQQFQAIEYKIGG